MAAEFDQAAPHEETSATEDSHEVRFGYLLTALILLVILYPFHNDSPAALVAFAAINSGILASSAFAASHSRRTLMMVLALSAPIIFLEWMNAFYQNPLVGDLRYLAIALFYGYTIYHVLREVLRPGLVTRDKISGAVAAYMLAAVGWSSLYGLADSLVPGSFSMAGQPDVGHPLSMQDLLFFSFTTLTTTGYGDITPISRHAQSLSILEQMAGTFYVAILIARLAGLYQPGTSKPALPHWRPWRPRRPPSSGVK